MLSRPALILAPLGMVLASCATQDMVASTGKARFADYPDTLISALQAACSGPAQAFSRPAVVRNSEFGYEMWFSYRSGGGQTYRIGYATSRDGRNWELELDNAGFEVSASGWDSEMIEYPFVFCHKGRYYMLYNGNDYGLTGFGLAVRTSRI